MGKLYDDTSRGLGCCQKECVLGVRVVVNVVGLLKIPVNLSLFINIVRQKHVFLIYKLMASTNAR